MNIGDIVYFYEHWSHAIEKCEIIKFKEIDDVKAVEVKSIGSVDKNGNIICKSYGTSTRRIEDLYPSYKAIYDALEKKSQDRTMKYMEEIKTIKDLIEFPLLHCLNGDEYTDYDAKKAYKQKVSEMFGVEFSDQDQIIVLSNLHPLNYVSMNYINEHTKEKAINKIDKMINEVQEIDLDI